LTIPESEFVEKPVKKKEGELISKRERVDLVSPLPNSGSGGQAISRLGGKKIEVGGRDRELGVGGEILNVRAEETPKQKSLDIFEKIKPKKKIKKIASKKHDDKFFNTIKEFLLKKNIEILDIQDFSKSEITLLIKENQEEKLLIAYNKKKISEIDIIKANQKALKLNLKYILISKGEPLKKTLNLLDAAKNLSKIEKLE